MTVTTTVLVPSKYLENAQTTQYIASNATTIIDKCSITNATGGNVTLAINLVTSGSAAGADNLFVSVSVGAGKSYMCPEIVGQTLRNGDFISAIAGAASSLSIRVSGREIT